MSMELPSIKGAMPLQPANVKITLFQFRYPHHNTPVQQYIINQAVKTNLNQPQAYLSTKVWTYHQAVVNTTKLIQGTVHKELLWSKQHLLKTSAAILNSWTAAFCNCGLTAGTEVARIGSRVACTCGTTWEGTCRWFHRPQHHASCSNALPFCNIYTKENQPTIERLYDMQASI